MTSRNPKMHGLSYILGYPTNEVSRQKIKNIALEEGLSEDRAWCLIVMSIIEELQNEESPASLSSILTLMMDRSVKAPKLYLIPYKMTTDGEDREYPMVVFQMRNVLDENTEELLEIDKDIADQLSQILQTTFDCEFVETVYVQ